MSRAADFEKILLGEQIATPDVVSRVDTLWNAIINGATAVPIVPKTPIEVYLANMIDDTVEIPQPKTRLDKIFYAICTGGTLDGFIPQSENEKILLEILNEGVSTNLFDINSVTSFYIWDGSSTTSGSIINGVITEYLGLYGNAVYCNSNVTSLEAGTYILSADVFLDYESGNKQIAIGISEEKHLTSVMANYKTWENKSWTFTIDATTEIFGFIFQPVGDAENYNNIPTKFKNIKLKKVGEPNE